MQGQTTIFNMNKLIHLSNTFYGAMGIPITLLDEHGDVIYEYPLHSIPNPLFPDKKQRFAQLFSDQPDNLCQYISTACWENYYSIPLQMEGNVMGRIVVGPTISSEADNKSITKLAVDLGVPFKHKVSLLSYLKSLPVMHLLNLQHACQLLSFALYQERLENYEGILAGNMHIVKAQPEDPVDLHSLHTGTYNPFRSYGIYVEQLKQYITEGNREKLNNHLKNPPGGKIPSLSKHPIRNIRYNIITSTSIIADAVINGGMDWEYARNLSNQYIAIADELNTEKELMELSRKMIFDYTDRMLALKNQNLSRITIKCQHYIAEHLYDKLTLPNLARHLNVNGSYLSHLFKKEVGTSLSEYIHKEKIEMAKQLAVSSDHSLTEIFVKLGFNDQSHFTKVFKKIAGITPKEYRMMYKNG